MLWNRLAASTSTNADQANLMIPNEVNRRYRPNSRDDSVRVRTTINVVTEEDNLMMGVPSAGFEDLVQLMKASVDVSNRYVSGWVPVHMWKYIACTMGWSNITDCVS